MCPDHQPATVATISPKLSDLPNKPPNLHLAESIQESQLLLGYVSRNGLDVDETVVTDIVQAKIWFEQGEWDAEKEIRFWNAFNTLAKTVHPVSVASLKADATSTVGFYQTWSFLVLAVLLLMQVYFVMGSVRYNMATESPPKIDQLMEQLSIEMESVPPELRVENRKINELSAEIDQRQETLTAIYRLLNDWSLKSLWQFAFPFGWFEEESPEGSIPITQAQVEILLQEKKFILQTVQFYILPLLYGLLGAFAFVLRSLNAEVRNLTYVATSNVNYRLRIQLGAFSGLAIGWFMGPDSVGSPSLLGSLSPFALAFLAGYSVEVLFTAMDGLITKFATPEKNTVIERQLSRNSSQLASKDSAK